MNSISGQLKGLFNASIRVLNQPIVKEHVKNVMGSMTFVFGLVEVYTIYQIARDHKISTEGCLRSSNWVQIANQVVFVCAKISLILSAGVSRPGVFIISSIAKCIFSTAQLERVFGPNTIFAVNPWHPRHVISMAAVILALPFVAQSTYKGVPWMDRGIYHQMMPINRQDTRNWLTDAKIRLMTLFNTITSRPALHIGNQLGRLISRHV